MSNETIFIEVFGNSPTMRVLDFLITFQAFDYPLTEITKNSRVSYSILQTFWSKLERNNIVVKTRRVGKSDMYKLNVKNPAVQQLIKLDWKLLSKVPNKKFMHKRSNNGRVFTPFLLPRKF